MTERKIAGHSYSAPLVLLLLQLVLNAAVSLRGSERVLTLINETFGYPLDRVPSWFSVRSWLMRVGHYKLMREKTQANDWCWILDHTIQLGKTKCLLILGIRLSELPARGESLHYADLEPINLLPVETSNGKVVWQQLEEAVKKTGIPRLLISDHGSDLKNGIKAFCTAHPHCVSVYDIKHKTACLLKQVMEKDEDWQTFRTQAAQTKNQLQQTALSHLKAPHQRSKARYMNMGILLKWGMETLQVIDNQPDFSTAEIQQLPKLEWLYDYRDKLSEWGEYLQVTTLVENQVRREGISRTGYQLLEQQYEKEWPTLKHETSRSLKTTLVDFIKEQGQHCQNDETLPGSSEIIESVFGKQKYLERDYAKEGFTSLILGIGALVGKTTVETVREALLSTPVEVVKKWCQENLGDTLQSKKKQAYAEAGKGTKTGSVIEA